MKLNLIEFHASVTPELKLKLMRSVRHMEKVVVRLEKALFLPTPPENDN